MNISVIEFPWLREPATTLAERSATGRGPQALLIHGMQGTGRRHLALWHAASVLGRPPAPFLSLLETEPPAADDDGVAMETTLLHPDLMVLRRPADKQVISIEAIRRMIQFLHLKSHGGGGRVAVIWPADTMTDAAANSLLKTLEEPPAGATIILVACSLSRLPPTIVSRCQRVRIGAPAGTVALNWLRQQSDDDNWPALLEAAGGAPLAALEAKRSGHAALMAELVDDLQQLVTRRATTIAVASRWARRDPELVLRWLYQIVAVALRDAVLNAGGEPLQSHRKGLNMQHLQSCLRDIEGLQRAADKPMNFELQLAALLQHWGRAGFVTGDAR